MDQLLFLTEESPTDGPAANTRGGMNICNPSDTKNSPGLINDNILIPLDTKPFMNNFNDANTENVTNGPVQLLPGNKPCALSY